MATLAKRGAGTPVTTNTTWTTVTNAVDGAAGTNPATYAVWTSTQSAGVATIEITGYDFSGISSVTDTLNSVTVSIRHLVANVSRFSKIEYQAWSGGVALGTIRTGTLSTSARNDSGTFACTLAQLKAADFKVRITITRAAVTQSATASIDYADVTADYTPPMKAGSGTTAHSWVPAAAGVMPVPVVPGAFVGFRSFNGTTSRVQLAVGESTTQTLDAYSQFALVRATAVGSGLSHTWFAATRAANRACYWYLNWTGYQETDYQSGYTSGGPNTGVSVAEGWVIVGMTKAAGAAPIYHKCVMSTGVWTHESGGGMSAVAAIGAGGSWWLGWDGSIGEENWAGDIAVESFHTRPLTTLEVEDLKNGLSKWLTGAVHVWPTDRTTVNDIVGTANQTSITAAPIGSGYSPLPNDLTSAALYGDGFNRADGVLAAPWVTIEGTHSIVNGKIPVGPLSPNVSYYDQTFAANQWAEADMTWVPAGGSIVCPTLRVNGSDFYYYWFDGSQNAQIFKRVGGVYTPVGTGTVAPTSFKARLEAEGTTLRAYINDTLVITATDTSIATGKPGILSANGGAGTLDNWRGGDLPYTPLAGAKTGTATVAWSATPTAVGKRTPKAQATTAYVEAPTGVGKRTPKSAPAVNFVEALGVAGKKISRGTTTSVWTVTASVIGVAPLPTPVGDRYLEDGSTDRVTEAGVERKLENWVEPPNQGTAAVPWVEALAAVGKRTPKAAGATQWTETLTAAGKKLQKSTVTTSYVEAVTAAGKRVARAAATAAHDWVAAAAGVKPVVAMKQGSATVTWTEALSSAGKRTPIATATTTWTEVTAAAGKRTPKSSLTTAWTEAVAAAGKRAPKATAVTQWVEAVLAAGKRAPKGSAIAGFLEAVSASGKKTPKGATSAAHSWVPAATGVKPIVGMNQGTAAVTWRADPVAIGYRMNEGAAATSYTWVASASGAKPMKSAATVSWSAVPAAAGKRVARATATTAVLWSPGGVGKRSPKAVVTAAWNAAVAAVGKKLTKGVAVTAWLEAVSSVGKRVPKGTITTTHIWVPLASGRKPLRGQATVQHTWTPAAVGSSSASKGIGSASVSWFDYVAAAGKRTPKSAVTTTALFSPYTVGKRYPSSVSFVAWTATPLVQGKRFPRSAVTVTHTWPVMVTGKKLQKSVVTITLLWQPNVVSKRVPVSVVWVENLWVTDADGFFMPVGVADTDYWFSQVALGIEGIAGRMEFYWNGEFGTAMQYGDKSVIEWLMIPS